MTVNNSSSIYVQVMTRINQLRNSGFVRPILLSESDYDIFRSSPRVFETYNTIKTCDPENPYAQEVFSWLMWDGYPIINESMVVKINNQQTLKQAKSIIEGK